MMNVSWTLRRVSLLTTIGILLMSVFGVTPSQGAVPGLDTIRVGIFLNYPGKYTVNTGAATLSSTGGVSVGVRQPAGTERWFAAGAGEQVRFSRDDYKVKLVETADFATALSVFKRVQSASGTGFLFSLWKNGQTVYQVTEGVYATASAASAAQARWKADQELQKLSGGYAPELQGPLHLKGGSYGTEAEAVNAAKAFGNAGVDAYVALNKADGGTLKYTVLVGSAADETALAAVQTKAAAVSSSLQRAADGELYLIKRTDHSITAKADASASMYLIPGNEMKVWVSPAGDDPIKLTERYNRTYRGSFEISVLNDRLAVVNELPFEQYLYSVVGSEMYASWPAEALKAQAVAARTYALYQGFGFQIAHVVDSVLSEAYGGTGAETPATRAAVDATAGEVLLYNGKLIEALFSSNGGGKTSDATEVWGNAVPYLKSVASPADSIAEKGLGYWYRSVLPSGVVGYIQESELTDTGRKNAAGKPILTVGVSGADVRKIPLVQSNVPAVATAAAGTEVVAVEKTVQSNAMSWVRGPFTSSELLASMKNNITSTVPSSIWSLQVTERGESGRVLAMNVNGTELGVKYPDKFRSALGSLPSTKFTVDETAKIVMSGSSATATRTSNAQPLYVMGADGKAKQLTEPNVFILNGQGDVRTATKEPSFRFTGTGNGHGIGLSQYGAYGLAEQGYDYQYILKYYYKDVEIVKE